MVSGINRLSFGGCLHESFESMGMVKFQNEGDGYEFCIASFMAALKYPAQYLATQFVDYEPGIHYSQCQMQAGCTGINAIRIYNPIKQSKDHDPDGVFIKQWIPELLECPNEFIHTPWDWISDQNTYVAPIVNEKEARKYASSQLYSLRKSQSFKQEAKKLF